jgi:hypothetical protein
MVMDDLWFLSVRMKKQYFSHLKNRNFVTFMDVFMVFVSENLNNRNFVTFMSVFLVFVSENGKTGTFSL